MGRTTGVTGSIKVRQATAREGGPYCIITLPRGIVQALDLKPGDDLMYYLSKDGHIVFRSARSVFEGQIGFDADILPRGEWKTPEPDTLTGRTIAVEAQLERAARISSGKATKEEKDAFNREFELSEKRMTRQAKALAHGRKYRSRRDR